MAGDDDSIDAEASTQRERPPRAAVPAEPPASGPRFELGRELGRGGMGRVVEAYDRQLERTVAVKLLLATTRDLAHRFRREARLTARLQHPGIVPVYEQGEDEDGHPYYAMRLVEGRTLEDALAEARDVEARLALVPAILQVIDTLAYAHAQHVIHRDLKPSNVLLGAFGEVLVADWGLAKDLADAPAPPSRRTGIGVVMGTPGYMAPEQAAGEDVDERADVYALAAILYRVLVGESPRPGTYTEALEAMYTRPRDPVAARAQGAPPALVAIVERGLAERPEDRYPTARELADDLRRYQAGQLVRAHRYSLGERAARLARRYRNVLLAVIAAAVAAATVGAIVFARVLEARDAARRAERDAIAERDAAMIANARGTLPRDPSRALALVAGIAHPEAALVRAAARAAGTSVELGRIAGEPRALAIAGGAIWIGDAAGNVGVLGAPPVITLARPIQQLVAADDALYAWTLAETVRIAGGAAAAPIACTRAELPPLVRGALFDLLALASQTAPAQGRVVCVDNAGLELVDLRTAARTRVLDRQLAPVRVDGDRVVGRDGDDALVAIDVAAGARVVHRALPATALALAGGTVFAGTDTELVALELATGTRRPLPTIEAPVVALAVSNGRLFALDAAGVLRVLDAATGDVVSRTFVGNVSRFAVAADGARIALAVDHELLVLPIGPGRSWQLRGHTAPVRALAWDGAALVTAATDGSVRRWALEEPRAIPASTPRIQPNLVFSPDGARVAIVDAAVVRELELATGRERRLAAGMIAAATYGADGVLVSVDYAGHVVRHGATPAAIGSAEPRPYHRIAAPAGRVVIFGAAAPQRASVVRGWTAAGAEVPTCAGPAHDLAPDGRALVGRYAICELDGTQHPIPGAADARAVRFVGGGGGIAIERAGAIEIRAGTRVLGTFPRRDAWAVSPDLARYAATSATSAIEVGTLGGGAREVHAPGLAGVTQLAWSSDGAHLAAVTADATCVWTPAISDEGYCLPQPKVGAAWFDPAGRYLATSSPTGILLWPL